MSMDLTGIRNRNEYYTNHYFASTFESNASDTIKAWREAAQGTELRTPWALLRDAGKQYFLIRNRQERHRGGDAYEKAVIRIARDLLGALDYDTVSAKPELEELPGTQEKVPVTLEINKANGAPLLWVILAAPEREEKKISDKDEEADVSDILGYVSFAADLRLERDKPFTEEALNKTPMEELLGRLLYDLDESPRWIILISENQVALIDRNKWNEKRFLVFDLDDIFGRNEESTLQAMAVLLHRESLCPTDGGCLLDVLDENSHRHAIDVSQKLKYALRQCIEILGNEVVYDMKERQHVGVFGRALAEDLTLQCLRYMYRILFMLFIEAKPELGYAPMKAQTYESGYSFESLREICEQAEGDGEIDEDGNFLKTSLDKLFGLVYNGFPTKVAVPEDADSLQGVFSIDSLKAHIFDPERTALIEKAHLRNGKLLQIINLMSLARGGRGQRRGRISYSNLGINQLGAVYEALLSYRGFFAEEDLYEVKRAGDKVDELDVGYFIPLRDLDKYTEEERVRVDQNDPASALRVHPKGEFIYRLAGREREKSASYYTPEVLTKCLVKYALKELLEGKSADEILELTVCEPAMGSAAFLNETVSQLAEAYLERKQKETGNSISHDQRQQELQKVKMLIADRNVYGIDLNPTAVELAEVSLWLNTIYQGGYVPWFRTQIVNGNSLIGARRQCYTLTQAQAQGPGAWYNSAPERVAPGEKRSLRRQQVYHFLLGDPGMCAYTDRVIKTLEPEKIAAIKKWNKEFIKPLNDSEADDVLRLCDHIDTLWAAHTQLRAEIKEKTTDPLSVWGQEEDTSHQRTTIRDKDRVYDNLYLSKGGSNASPYARLKAVMDYWCALWFWPIDKADELPNRMEFLWDVNMLLGVGVVDTSNFKGRGEGQVSLFDDIEMDSYGQELVGRYGKYGAVNLDQLRSDFPRLRIANEVAEQQKFFHWELEFSDVFEERGGFDLMIGNPPWEKITWNEQDLLSEYNPMYGIKGWKAPEVAKQRKTELLSNNIRVAYIMEYISLTGIQNFMASAQNYAILKGQQTNLYKGFLPQAWDFGHKKGISAFIHQDSIFDDPNGAPLRKVLYPKLRKHFRFNNKFLLFPISTSREFSLNVYSNLETKTFECINNLFDPCTIDDCYDPDCSYRLYGLKDDNNNWCKTGHPDRIISVGKKELLLFAKLFDNSDLWQVARLPVLHAKPIIDVLECFAKQNNKVEESFSQITVSEFWHETNSVTKGIIERNIHFPQNTTELIISGAHVGVGNPLFKTSRRNCISRYDFDPIDLTEIPDDYMQRCNYIPIMSPSDYISEIPKHSDNYPITNYYKFVARKMVNLPGDRTFMGAIIPPRSSHINGVISLTFSDYYKLVSFSAGAASVPYDFFIKLLGKQNLYGETLGLLPILPYNSDLLIRCLMLNSLNNSYIELWEKMWDEEYKTIIWSKKDIRLKENTFKNLTKDWQHTSALRTDYERRWAMVELDVLVAFLMGLTLSDLLAIYRIYFPVLKQNEEDTWYDANGRIIFTTNATLTGVGFERNMFEKAGLSTPVKRGSSPWNGIMKDAPAGYVFERTITDDTMPGGPVQRTIEYVAPFDRCDREKDYETAWEFFSKKYN